MTALGSRLLAASAALCVFALLPLVLSDWLLFLIALALAKGAVVLGVVLLLRGGLISFGHALYLRLAPILSASSRTDLRSARR